jgi:hypothetical protein
VAEDRAVRLIEALDLDRLASLAIMGLGKNAGKTTVLNHLIRTCAKAGLPRVLALTSVGRDGEDQDLVTGGMKPRIYVREGTLIATAAGSVGKSDAVLEILALTGIRTATGEVAVARARSNGYLELAGPSIARDLALCETFFRREEADCLYIIDGALDRKSQAGGGLTEAVVLVAGMANAASIEELAEKTAVQAELLKLPSLAEEERQEIEAAMEGKAGARAAIRDIRGEVRLMEMPSLAGHGKEVAQGLAPGDRILFLRGAVTERFVEDLLSNKHFRQMTLAAEDGTRYFIGGRTLARLKQQGVKLEVIHPLILPMVFVNPARGGGSQVDARELVKAVSTAVDVPVMDTGPALV